jgi:folylpolyglutamate synthase/dihydropteroate synthase
VNSANTTVTENDGLTLESVTGAGVENKVEVEVVLDVGHNPAAMAALVARIREEYSDRNLR